MRRFAGACALLILTVAPSGVLAQEIPTARPSAVGMSADKLARVDAAVQRFVEEEAIAGGITVVARRGKIVHFEAVGLMDVKNEKPMRRDTIFRIYSMSKPITSVAAMMLVEAGKLKLDDPVSKHLPALAGLKLYAEASDGSPEPVTPDREMTIFDLLRHTSGLTYGIFGDSPVDRMYREADVLARDASLKTMVEKLGKLPLLYAPGTRLHYGVSTDVLGRVVEVVSGQNLDRFFQQRIFDPLDMKDTGFHVPAAKLDRFAANYSPKPGGGLRPIDTPATSRYRSRPGMLSGGGGLVSTARDYLRFCQMLLNRGELHGTRLLRAETVDRMTANQLSRKLVPIRLGGDPRPGVGFGLGFSVRVAASETEPRAPIGEYGWGGMASTHFWISPKHELIVIALSQHVPYSSRLERAIKPLVYDAMQR